MASMPDILLRDVVAATLKLRAGGDPITLLGICPMSEELIRVPIQLAAEHGFPLLFVASRNQISEDASGGYVMGLDQARFLAMIEEIESRETFSRPYLRFVSVDHCGPWYKEREKSLGEAEALDSVKRTLTACVEAGYAGIHIDCTFKGPAGVEMDEAKIIRMTADLFAFTEAERRRLAQAPIAYEIGTEESSGAGVSAAHFKASIEKMLAELKNRGLPLPTFAVGRTGAKLEMLENTGGFDYASAARLPEVAAGFGIGFKEHNADYLSTPVLSLHPAYGITAANVGPEFAVAGTRALLEMESMEKGLPEGKRSRLYSVMSEAVLEKAPFHKWLRKGDDWTADALRKMPAERRAVTLAAGHYITCEKEVEEARRLLFRNLSAGGILKDPQRHCDAAVAAAIMRCADAFNLRGSTQKILAAL